MTVSLGSWLDNIAQRTLLGGMKRSNWRRRVYQRKLFSERLEERQMLAADVMDTGAHEQQFIDADVYDDGSTTPSDSVVSEDDFYGGATWADTTGSGDPGESYAENGEQLFAPDMNWVDDPWSAYGGTMADEIDGYVDEYSELWQSENDDAYGGATLDEDEFAAVNNDGYGGDTQLDSVEAVGWSDSDNDVAAVENDGYGGDGQLEADEVVDGANSDDTEELPADSDDPFYEPELSWLDDYWSAYGEPVAEEYDEYADEQTNSCQFVSDDGYGAASQDDDQLAEADNDDSNNQWETESPDDAYLGDVEGNADWLDDEEGFDEAPYVFVFTPVGESPPQEFADLAANVANPYGNLEPRLRHILDELFRMSPEEARWFWLTQISADDVTAISSALLGAGFSLWHQFQLRLQDGAPDNVAIREFLADQEARERLLDRQRDLDELDALVAAAVDFDLDVHARVEQIEENARRLGIPLPPGAALQIAQWLERQRRGQGPALERGHGNGVPNVAGHPLVIFAGEFAFTWNAQGQIVVYDDPQVIEGTPPNLEAAGIPAEFDATIGDLVSGRRHQPTPEERALINGLLGFPTQELLGDYITLPGGISLRDLLGALPDDVKQDIELFQALAAVLTGTGETLLELQELERQGATVAETTQYMASSVAVAAFIELLTLKLGDFATPAIRALAKKFFGEGPGRNLPAQLQKEVIEELARHGDKVTAESAEQFLNQLAQRLDDKAAPVTKEIIEEVGEATLGKAVSPSSLTYDALTQSWHSPGGLVYGQGSVDGNRVLHILEHLEANSSKTIHSVFNVERNKLVGLLDEAWAKRANPLPNDPGAYVIEMGRTIGTAGETAIKIIVKPGTSEIITAYPVL